jgi:hypothetical protein
MLGSPSCADSVPSRGALSDLAGSSRVAWACVEARGLEGEGAFVEATPAPWATSKVAACASETAVARCASVAYPLRRIRSAKSELCTARVSVGPPAAAAVEATPVVSACKAQHALHTRTRTGAESGAIGCPSSCSSGARVVIGVQREGHRGTGTTPRGLPNMDCLTWTGQAEDRASGAG